MTELRAAYFHLYGIEPDDVEYILSTFTNTCFTKEDDRAVQEECGLAAAPVR